MPLTRHIEPELISLSQQYPVVTVLGPRQSGKTTVVRKTFPKKPYVNLEDPETRGLAHDDPRGFLGQFPDGAVLDEIQREPTLLSYIQVRVDENPEPGQFILTGSHQPELHAVISQSLAGRTALLTLYPFSMAEMKDVYDTTNPDRLIVEGFFPRLYDPGQTHAKAHANYIATYLERDVRQITQIKDLMSFQKFLHLCAGRVGQLLNMNGLANDVGVSSNTIKQWISVLQASFMVVLLPPFYENVGKRLMKSPKLYFTDVGLASYLLGIRTPEQAQRDPLRGSLFENLVVMEFYKHLCNQGIVPELYFYRDHTGQEVDIVYKHDQAFYNVEIKSSETYQRTMLKSLRAFSELVTLPCHNSLVYAGEGGPTILNVRLLNYQRAGLALG